MVCRLCDVVAGRLEVALLLRLDVFGAGLSLAWGGRTHRHGLGCNLRLHFRYVIAMGDNHQLLLFRLTLVCYLRSLQSPLHGMVGTPSALLHGSGC
jgi:hypothetical protein